MSVSDLTGTKWLLNSDLEDVAFLSYAYDSTVWDSEESRDTFEIGITGVNAGHLNFTSNNENFVGLLNIDYSPLEGGNCIEVYHSGSEEWTDQPYRTIEITGGTDATNPDLIAWLSQNATQIIPVNPSISIGTSALTKAFIGATELSSMWLGNVKLWEKASSYDYNYSSGTLTINNAPYNYDNGVLTIE